MELLDNLAAIGITTKVLQYVFLAAIAIVVIGIYWRYIVAGAAIVACVYVFLLPAQSTSIASNGITSQADIAPAEFIEDCMKYTEGATKDKCQKLWKDDGNGKN
jgi:hypothetical protein